MQTAIDHSLAMKPKACQRYVFIVYTDAADF